jgi:hypothetical protein
MTLPPEVFEANALVLVVSFPLRGIASRSRRRRQVVHGLLFMIMVVPMLLRVRQAELNLQLLILLSQLCNLFLQKWVFTDNLSATASTQPAGPTSSAPSPPAVHL